MGEEDLDVGFLLKRITTAIGHNADQGFKPVTLSQMRVIMYIARSPGQRCCQKDIEARFGVSHPTVVGLLKRLEAKGLVATNMSATDKRRKEVFLTAAGNALLDEAMKHRVSMEKQLRKGLTEEDLRQLRRLLTQIYQNTLEATRGECGDLCCPTPLSITAKEEGEHPHGR